MNQKTNGNEYSPLNRTTQELKSRKGVKFMALGALEDFPKNGTSINYKKVIKLMLV